MSDITKISIKVGSVEFSGEGKESWLEKQLDKILKEFKTVIENPIETREVNKAEGSSVKINSTTLASFLGEKNAKSNQVRKFLATALFLQEIKNMKPIKTGDVTKALKDSSQGRLGNPSDTLSQNITKGFCERDNGGFFVTEDGYTELGLTLS